MPVLHDHERPRHVTARGPFAAAPLPSAPVGSEEFIAAAGYASRLLPTEIHDALVDLQDAAPQAGAILLRGLPICTAPELPPTPSHPTARVAKDATSEATLLAVARRLGQPVGYLPEHGGDVIQNIVPTRSSVDRQVSTSSAATLMFHTEAAFHPYRPRYLLLLCLRGDPAAATTLASIFEVLPLLSANTVDTLFQPRFRTAVDESYLHGRRNCLGPIMPVLHGRRDRPSMIFDLDLMVGVDDEAGAALAALAEVITSHHTSVVLQAGDVLVVDNDVAVHGRTPYTPRFDGTDRWLQRTFVVSDLAPSAADRDGRVIRTTFGL